MFIENINPSYLSANKTPKFKCLAFDKPLILIKYIICSIKIPVSLDSEFTVIN